MHPRLYLTQIETDRVGFPKEHLECTLPRVEDVTGWAAARGLRCEAEPKGTLTAAHALLFMEFFGRRQGAHAELEMMDSERYPGAYLLTLLPS